MPFQITLTHGRGAPAFIELVTAGPDQLHICTPTITLTAEIIGDPAGHIFLWEQLEGTIVSLDTPNELSTDFAAVDSTDKLFRFWIDKGSPEQQFDEMWIFKTPFSDCPFSQDNDNSDFNISITADPVACDDIIATFTISAPSPSSPHGEEPLPPIITVPVEWQHPGDPLKDLYISQYEVFENNVSVAFVPPIPPATIGDPLGPPADLLEYAGSLSTYRIDTHYNISNIHVFTEPSCEKDFTGLVVPVIKIYNDTTAFSQDNTSSLFGRVDFVFIQKSIPDPTVFSMDNTNREFNRIDFDFIKMEEQDNTSFSQSVGDNLINITRVDQQGIGS